MSVSVPLRGRGDERGDFEPQFPMETPVSVPLRGRGDERLAALEMVVLAALEMFQSPCGEGVMKDSVSNIIEAPTSNCFSPLAGKG